MTPEPTPKHYVALDKLRRVLGHHDVKLDGEYTADSLKDITDEYPSSIVESFTTNAVAAVPGCVLSTDGQTASRHDDDPELDTISSRRDEVLIWAADEYPKAIVHDYGVSLGVRTDDLFLRQLVTVFRGFVYNTLWLAANPVNLDDPKWNLLKNNLRSWHDFSKYLSPENARSLAQSNSEFYSGDVVFIWNALDTRKLLKVRNVSNVLSSEVSLLDADSIPNFSLATDHLEVRKLLGLNVLYDVHVADLSALTAQDQDDNDILITPAFDSNVLAYTAEVDNTVTSITISPTAYHNFASVEIDGDTSISTLPETFSIHLVSEDKETEKTYTLTISRSTE